MSIYWSKSDKRWRFEFDRYVAGRRHRLTRLLPQGWSQAQADTFDRTETARLYGLASGIARDEPLIDQAVKHYLTDKSALKSYKSAVEHLGAIAWAWQGRPMSELPAVAQEVISAADASPATLKNRLALLKAACRWAWKRHGLTDTDPTARMLLPAVRNARKVYLTREGMLKACRACGSWQAQIAIRVCFYTGMRLGELWHVTAQDNLLVLTDSKNGQPRIIPAHPRIRHLLKHLPLTGHKRGVQASWTRAKDKVGLGDVRFHDLRHSAASEMANAGVPLFTVGQVLGHKSPVSTQRYAHLYADTLAAAVGQIGRKRA